MTEKACRECGEVKQISDFHAHRKMKDGHLNQCKSCVLSRMKSHRIENIDSYRKKENTKSELERKSKYKATDRGKESSRECSSRYRKKNLAKKAAQQAVIKAIKSGKLWKSPCCMAPGCFSTERIHGHHTHYEDKLSVVWLCNKCHKKLHTDFDRKIKDMNNQKEESLNV